MGYNGTAIYYELLQTDQYVYTETQKHTSQNNYGKPIELFETERLFCKCKK